VLTIFSFHRGVCMQAPLGSNGRHVGRLSHRERGAGPESASKDCRTPRIMQGGGRHEGEWSILPGKTEELLTVEEAADVLGVGVQRMYNLRNLGQGPVSYRRGRRLVYPRSGLVAFLARELQAIAKGEGAPSAEGK
jgi:hypothetical protein